MSDDQSEQETVNASSIAVLANELGRSRPFEVLMKVMDYFDFHNV